MPDIVGLPDEWRAKAKELRVNVPLEDRPLIGFTSDQVAAKAAADQLGRCAHDLELAWHQHAHDGEFRRGCNFCDWEREHNELYPDA